MDSDVAVCDWTITVWMLPSLLLEHEKKLWMASCVDVEYAFILPGVVGIPFFLPADCFSWTRVGLIITESKRTKKEKEKNKEEVDL